ncbi:unnamed protein product [Lasius platythorax]|uniref:Uncharacterized protein n=1 Tax=Lasius platythorax TaxID=488582 RepID=A0AAV2NU08_9HYME
MQSDRWIRRCDFTAATLRAMADSGEPGPDEVEALHAKCARRRSIRYVLRPSKVESPRSPLLRTGAGVSSH